MPDVYVVGGRGYVGSFLVPQLERHYDVEVLDPGYLISDTPDATQDVTAPGFQIPDDEAPVVWLACIHRLPEGCEDPEWQWGDYADRLMVECPKEWAAAGHPLIYVSSMQVVCPGGGHRDLYAIAKAEFEEWAVGRAGVTVIRPGTVWGLHESHPANRLHTVPNRYLATGVLPDGNWRAYTTGVDYLVEMLQGGVWRALEYELGGDVVNVVDRPYPIAVDHIEPGALEPHPIANARHGIETTLLGHTWKIPEHPMARLARARGLPWKETV